VFPQPVGTGRSRLRAGEAARGPLAEPGSGCSLQGPPRGEQRGSAQQQGGCQEQWETPRGDSRLPKGDLQHGEGDSLLAADGQKEEVKALQKILSFDSDSGSYPAVAVRGWKKARPARFSGSRAAWAAWDAGLESGELAQVALPGCRHGGTRSALEG